MTACASCSGRQERKELAGAVLFRRQRSEHHASGQHRPCGLRAEEGGRRIHQAIAHRVVEAQVVAPDAPTPPALVAGRAEDRDEVVGGVTQPRVRQVPVRPVRKVRRAVHHVLHPHEQRRIVVAALAQSRRHQLHDLLLLPGGKVAKAQAHARGRGVEPASTLILVPESQRARAALLR